MKYLDYFLDRITMYRLVLYALIALLIIAFIFCFTHTLPYAPFTLLISTIFLLAVCLVTNNIFASVFEAPTNVESAYITALILALIITPTVTGNGLIFLAWAGIWAMASKYILAIKRKHLFNPAAIAVVITAFFINQSASWWVGNAAMMPIVVIVGYMIMRKIQKEDLMFYFFIAAIATILFFTFLKGGNPITTLTAVALHSSLFFFAFIMLTEPLTTPPTKRLQIIYGALVGFLFAPDIHLGGLYSTPELALIAGNIFAYLVSSKQKLFLKVKQKIQAAPGTIDFIFTLPEKLGFKPGQYMEWTLAHNNPDGRGNRRFFTIASSPTEDELRLGVKFYENGSSYKRAMQNMDTSTTIVGAQLAGDFTLPDDPNIKLAFIAGGIGITPFRSMIKYLIDIKQPRSVVLLYSNPTISEIVYSDIFYQAYQELGIKTVYTLTDKTAIPANWKGRTGRIDETMIREELPDYLERTFYISGPNVMVTVAKQLLRRMGVKPKQIITDFFPGLV